MPQARFGSPGLGFARCVWDPARARDMGKITRINANQKLRANDVLPDYESYYEHVLSES